MQKGQKYPFHPGVEIFSFQPEVKGTCILKKIHPGLNFTSPTCNMPLGLKHWILKLLVATQKSEVWEQNRECLFSYFNFERNYDVLNSKSPCILLNKNISFNKNETESKMENPTQF